MRLNIKLAPVSDRALHLPVHYNQIVQAMIYANLDRALSGWLHDEGHRYGQRHYRFFTFGRLTGRASVRDGRITFNGPVGFQLASANEDILCSLAEHMLKRPTVQLGAHCCVVEEVGIEPRPEVDFSKPVLLRSLSPITTYSTLSTPEGQRKTYYYAPQEREWSAMIVANLARKARALEWVSDVDRDLEGAWARPHRVSNASLKIIRYKQSVIKGWTGLYEANLPEPYFRLAYDSGLGSKNSMGFGMVEVVR